MEQSIFLTTVRELVAKGKQENGSITEEMLATAFRGEELNGEQMLSIRTYLKSNGVEVVSTGEKPSNRIVKMTAAKNVSKLEAQEQMAYRIYLEEIAGVPGYDPLEEADLIAKKVAGDGAARNRLIEGNLAKVVELAGIYAGHGAPVGDLVQEGNMELLMLVDEWAGGDLQEELKLRVSEAMERVVEEYDGNVAFKMRMADMANQIMDLSAEIAEELGKQPTLEELAKELHITVDEVEAIMKMSMDAMTIDQDIDDDPEA